MLSKEKRLLIPMNMRFFDGGDAPTPEPPAPQPEPATQPTPQPAPQKTNYQELYDTDKDFQSWFDKKVTGATQTAVQNAIQKQQRLADERLSESERLKEMTADQRASYWEQKAKDAESARKRDKEIDSLKEQTTGMLTSGNIPTVFLDVFDFNNATAEDIQGRVKMLSDYEYYPKGELEKRVTAAVNEKLKQAAPETHMQQTGAQPKDLNSALSEFYKK